MGIPRAALLLEAPLVFHAFRNKGNARSFFADYVNFAMFSDI
jgi:hypothetical protein